MKFFSSKSKKFSNNIVKKYQKKSLFKSRVKKKNLFLEDLINRYKIDRYSSFISTWSFLYINGYFENKNREFLNQTLIKNQKIFEKPKIILKTKVLPKEIKKIYIDKVKYELKYIPKQEPIINLTTKDKVTQTTIDKNFIKSIIQREEKNSEEEISIKEFGKQNTEYKTSIIENVKDKYKFITNELVKPYLIKNEIEKLREVKLQEIIEKEKRVKEPQLLIQREIDKLLEDKVQYKDKFTNLVSESVREKLNFIDKTLFLKQNLPQREIKKLFTTKTEDKKFIELKSIIQRKEKEVKDKLLIKEFEKESIKYKTFNIKELKDKYKFITNELVKPYLIKSEVEKLKEIKLQELIEKDRIVGKPKFLIQREIDKLLEDKVQYKDKFTNLVSENIREKISFLNKTLFLKQNLPQKEIEKLFTTKTEDKKFIELKSIIQREEKQEIKYKTSTIENVRNKYKFITNELVKPYLIKSEIEKLKEIRLQELIEKEKKVKEPQLLIQREINELKEKEFLTNEIYKNLEKTKIQYKDKFTNLISESVREKLNFINQTLFLKQNLPQREIEKLFTTKTEDKKFIELKSIIQREEKESKESIKYKTLNIKELKDRYSFITNDLVKPYLIKSEIEKLKEIKLQEIIEKDRILEKPQSLIQREIRELLKDKIQYRDKFTHLISESVREKLNFINKTLHLKKNITQKEIERLLTTKIEDKKFIELKPIIQREEKQDTKYKTLTIEQLKDKYKFITNDLVKPYLIKSEIEKLKEIKLQEIIEKDRIVEKPQSLIQREIRELLKDKIQYRDKFTNLISESVKEKLNFLNKTLFLKQDITKREIEKSFITQKEYLEKDNKFIELKPIIQREKKDTKEKILIKEFEKQEIKYKTSTIENVRNKYKFITNELVKPYLIKSEIEKLKEIRLQELIEKEKKVKEPQLLIQREINELKEKEFLTNEIYKNLEKTKIQYKDKFTNLISESVKEKLNFLNKTLFLKQDITKREIEKLFITKTENKKFIELKSIIQREEKEKTLIKEAEKESIKYKTSRIENIRDRYSFITNNLIKPYLIKSEIEKLKEVKLQELIEKDRIVGKPKFLIQREIEEALKDKIQYKDKFTNLINESVRDKLNFLNQNIFLKQNLPQREIEKLFTTKFKDKKFIELEHIIQREEKEKTLIKEAEKESIKYKTSRIENIRDRYNFITNNLIKPYLIKSEIEKLKEVKLQELIEKDRIVEKPKLLIQREIKELLEEKVNYKDKFTNLISESVKEKLNFLNKTLFLKQDITKREIEKLFTTKTENKKFIELKSIIQREEKESKESIKYKILNIEQLKDRYKFITNELVKPYLIKSEVEKLKEIKLQKIVEKEKRVKEPQLLIQKKIDESLKYKIQYRDKFTNLINESIRDKLNFLNQNIFLKQNLPQREIEKLFTTKFKDKKFIELKPIIQREEKQDTKYKTLTIEQLKDKYNFITNELIKPYLIKSEVEKLKEIKLQKIVEKEKRVKEPQLLIQKKIDESLKYKIQYRDKFTNLINGNIKEKLNFINKILHLKENVVEESIQKIFSTEIKDKKFIELKSIIQKEKKQEIKYKTSAIENVRDKYKFITNDLIKSYLIKNEVEKLKEKTKIIQDRKFIQFNAQIQEIEELKSKDVIQQRLIEREKISNELKILIQKEAFIKDRVCNLKFTKNLYQKVNNDNLRITQKMKINRETTPILNTLEKFDFKIKKEIINSLNLIQKNSTILSSDIKRLNSKVFTQIQKVPNTIHSTIKTLNEKIFMITKFLYNLLSNKNTIVKRDVFDLTNNLISKYGITSQIENNTINAIQTTTIAHTQIEPQNNRVISAKAYKAKTSKTQKVDIPKEVKPQIIKEKEIEYIETNENVDLEINKIDILVNIENKLDELALKIYRQLKDEISLEYIRNGL